MENNITNQNAEQKQNLQNINANQEAKKDLKKLTKSAIRKIKKSIVWDDIERFNPDYQTGLNDAQVDKRVQETLTNRLSEKRGKTILEIFISNIFTFFNMIYIFLATVLIIYGQWNQITFALVAFFNTAIAIFQEIRSKRSLDKLKLVNAPKATVVRNGTAIKIDSQDIVLDDIVVFSTGSSICVDSIVQSGYVEVNESILTGESDSIVKNVGDTLFAGSFVTAGACVAKTDKVAEYNYIENLTSQAVKYQKPRSQMLKSLKMLLKVIAIIIVPVAIFMWMSNYDAALHHLGDDMHQVAVEAITKTAGSIIGMIPAGAFLLTTIALAVSVLRLAKRRTMVQELYCIEMLARVDVLCLDKTGTLTDGTMEVVDYIELTKSTKYTVRDVIGSMNHALKDQNMTSIALKKYFGDDSIFNPKTIVPFSSKRKYSAVSFEKEGTFYLGAPEFVSNTPNPKVEEIVKRYAQRGYRVLLLTHTPGILNDKKEKEEATSIIPKKPIAVIAIQDGIRPEAKDTIKWFVDNNVAVKIITGDNPVTASFIARKVGVPDSESYVSLEGMTDEEVEAVAMEYTIFGRVTPEQKAVLVKALRKNGKTVAMTGDGVNDILAMRESDCAIAMGSGSEAAFNASHLVLLDNNFANMPSVVNEGRKVVNNIQSASSMYFMKTVFVIGLNIMVLLGNYAFGMTVSYPFTAANMMLLELAVIGLPTTILALQPNNEIIRGEFIKNAIRRSLPPGLTYLITTVALYFVCTNAMTLFGQEITLKEFSTIAMLVFTYASLFALFLNCKPLNPLRIAVIVISILCVLIGTFVPFLSDTIFEIMHLNGLEVLLVLVGIAVSVPIMMLIVSFFKGENKCKKQPSLQEQVEA